MVKQKSHKKKPVMRMNRSSHLMSQTEIIEVNAKLNTMRKALYEIDRAEERRFKELEAIPKEAFIY